MTGVIGGALGILSLLLPWIGVSGQILGQKVIGVNYTLLALLQNAANTPELLYIVAGLIIIGSLLAFFKPAGGILQLGSWVLFSMSAAGASGGSISGLVGASVSFQIGFFLAVFASIITLCGFALGKKQKEKFIENVEPEGKTAPAKNIRTPKKKGFCMYCGVKLDEDSIFCQKCGKMVKNANRVIR